MKHIFELRMKDQIEERSSQLLRNLSSCEKKAWKKIQAWTGFEPMTSAMPVTRSFFGYSWLLLTHMMKREWDPAAKSWPSFEQHPNSC